MRSSSIFISLFSLIIPLPIYFDLYQMNIIWNKVDDLIDQYAPLPLGAIVFGIYIISSFIRFIFFKKNDLYFSKNEFIIIIGAISIFFLQIIFVSSLDLLKSIQLIVPILVILLITRLKFDYRLAAIPITFSLAVFELNHINYLFFEFDDPLKLLPIQIINYHNGSIYSGLVSYPAVLSITYFISLYLASDERLLTRLYGFFISYLFVFFICIFGRKISILDFFQLMFIALIYLIYYYRIKFTKSIKKVAIILINQIIIICLVLMWGTAPIANRLSDQINDNDLTSGRLEIWMKIFDVFDIDKILFGYGGIEISGMHNLLLDTAFRIGIIGSIFYLLILIFTIIILTRSIYSESHVNGDISKLFMTSFLLILIGQSIFNIGVTQPYFVINWITAILIISAKVSKNNIIKKF